MDQDQYQLLIDKALKLLSIRPRSQKELYGKLFQYSFKRGIAKKTIDKVITDLEERKLVSDKAFISWWVDQRDTFRPKGKMLLKQELRQKGIATADIEEFFSVNKLYRSEFEKALTVAQKKLNLYKNLPKVELKQKLEGALARRGFDWDTIYDVIDTMIKKE
ncbi:regulatory protein RecX [Candidatus Gottesmanbacteria bacterium]|nr:regulatory protein RecX [Candidatus Gottesmanbacteria bacterium]